MNIKTMGKLRLFFNPMALSCRHYLVSSSLYQWLFTPLQMHGATYTVDAEFKTDALVEKSNWVVDIGAASEMLAAVLSKYNFKNLNEVFPGQNTTTEFMCKVRMDRAIKNSAGFAFLTRCPPCWCWCWCWCYCCRLLCSVFAAGRGRNALR